MLLSDIHQHPQLLEWRRQAEAAWREPSHPGWQVLQEEIVSGATTLRLHDSVECCWGCSLHMCFSCTGMFLHWPVFALVCSCGFR